MFDNLMREGAATDSKLLGNATGTATVASAQGSAGAFKF